MYHCEVCNKDVSMKNKNRHLQLPIHKKNEPLPIIIETDNIENTVVTNEEKDFLDELNNENYKFEENEPKQKPEKIPKLPKIKREIIHEDNEEEDELFSKNPTPLLGKDKLILINKVKNYKMLFSKELKKFRVKKNPSVEELEESITEIETILSLSNVDLFVVEGILTSIQMIEGTTKLTKYNISGLSDILRSNPQFISLSRQLYLKYGNFINVPVEYQMLMLIATSTFIVLNHNKGINQMDDFLNQPTRNA